MNYSMILYVVGWVLNIEAALMLPSVIVGVIYRENAFWSLLIGAALCLAVGGTAIFRKPKNTSIYSREGFVIVAFSWIALSIFGAFPFVFSGAIPNYVDALFETVSGFTTTGSSILPEVEPLPKCILFWRSFTHWIGGMGVLVFLMAILPLAAGGSGMYMMKAESPGPVVGKLVPRIKSTAKRLYAMYIFLCVLMFFFLIIGKMPLYDSLCTVFGTAGTGGFGIKNDSFASYSPYLQYVVSVFMMLFGVNFSFYYLLYQRKPRAAFQMTEVRVYLVIIALSIAFITINIAGKEAGFADAFRKAVFQVGSIITTTGFANADFDLWPSFSKTLLVLLMFCGACAGSTGGGMKVSRLVILFKAVKKELEIIAHPHNIQKVKMDGKVVEHTVLRGVNVFLVAYLMLFASSLLLISLDNFDFTTNFTAVTATINNIGPGLNAVGPTQNFAGYSVFSKLIFCIDMLAGRLELFPLLILLSRNTWRK